MSESQSDTLPPKKKRQRKDSDEDPRTRSQYWFKDGNIVLHAEDTLFRVHQSILSRHSQIFEDTFAMPQAPSQENEIIEGCPVIPLSDTAGDLGNIISLLYDNDKALKYGNKLPANVLGSMLRLGRKYVIAHLEKEALDRLHHDYPTTLEDWDLLYDGNQIEGSRLIGPTTEIICIAHEFQLFTILPAAYAQYLKWRCLENLVDDDSIPEDARKHCIIGHARILVYVKDRIVDALSPPLVLPSKACTNRKCEVNSWKTVKNLPVWRIVENETFGIFMYSATVTEGTETTCSRCRTEAKKFTETVRSEFWSNLPIFFELPAWADLKDGP